MAVNINTADTIEQPGGAESRLAQLESELLDARSREHHLENQLRLANQQQIRESEQKERELLNLDMRRAKEIEELERQRERDLQAVETKCLLREQEAQIAILSDNQRLFYAFLTGGPSYSSVTEPMGLGRGIPRNISSPQGPWVTPKKEPVDSEPMISSQETHFVEPSVTHNLVVSGSEDSQLGSQTVGVDPIHGIENSVERLTKLVEMKAPGGVYRAEQSDRGNTDGMVDNRSTVDTPQDNRSMVDTRPSQALYNSALPPRAIPVARANFQPPPPKMATFDGGPKTTWNSYIIQFERMAVRYGWSEVDKLDRLSENLREQALNFYSALPVTVRENYGMLREKLEHRFGKKDLPVTVRWQLQDLVQMDKESLDEFGERAQMLALKGFPEAQVQITDVLAVDAFLRGCSDKTAALTVADKHPTTIDGAVELVKSAVHNHRVVMGSNRGHKIRQVGFHDPEAEWADSGLSANRSSLLTPLNARSSRNLEDLNSNGLEKLT